MTDANGVSSTATVWATLGSSGVTPVALLEAQETVDLPADGQPLVLTLRGSRSLGGNNKTYIWSQVQGVPTVVEGTETGTIRLTQPGTYTFNLQVSNASGVTSAPTPVTFRVRPAAEVALASGGSFSKSSGGCSVAPAARPSWEAWFLALLVAGLAGLRLRPASPLRIRARA